MSSHTTILVPTYGRPHHLQRLLSFFSKEDCSHSILVADSSDCPEASKQVTKTFEETLSLQFESYPSDVPLIEKILDALALIKTDFCQVCADDDFIAPVGITACDKFLQNNREFVAAQGRCVHYRMTGIRNDIFSVVKLEHNEDLSSADPKDRLLDHMVGYRPTFYCLHRTEELFQFFSTCGKKGHDLLLQEVLPSALTAIYGKVKRLDVPFEYRELHGGRLSGRLHSWDDLIVSGDWIEKRDVFCQVISEALTAQGIDESDSEVASTVALQAWLNTYFHAYYRAKPEAKGRVAPRQPPQLLARKRTIIARAIGRGIHELNRLRESSPSFGAREVDPRYLPPTSMREAIKETSTQIYST